MRTLNVWMTVVEPVKTAGQCKNESVFNVGNGGLMAEVSRGSRPDEHAAADTSTNEEWIQAAVDEHAQPLLRYAARLLHGDTESARDIVQDTFVRLCQADRETLEGHLTEWLYTVCRNRTLDVLRKGRRMSTLTDIESSHRLRDDGASHPSLVDAPNVIAASMRNGLLPSQAAASSNRSDVSTQVEQPEQTSKAVHALEQLPDNQQEVIRLKFQAGLSYKEIARVTNLSVSNVGFLIHTGMKSLRETFGASPASPGVLPDAAAS